MWIHDAYINISTYIRTLFCKGPCIDHIQYILQSELVIRWAAGTLTMQSQWCWNPSSRVRSIRSQGMGRGFEFLEPGVLQNRPQGEYIFSLIIYIWFYIEAYTISCCILIQYMLMLYIYIYIWYYAIIHRYSFTPETNAPCSVPDLCLFVGPI